MRTCRVCKIPKEETEFSVRHDRPGQRYFQCRACNAEKKRLWRANASEEQKEKGRERVRNWRAKHPLYHVKRNYGLPTEDYEKLFFLQNGVCAICKEKSDKMLCVDHDHVTQKVRGLLCNGCNTALGMVKESIQTLSSAVEYLRLNLK